MSALLEYSKKSPVKEGKLSSRHRLSQTSLLPSMKKTLTVADEDEYYDEEYDEEEDGLDKIDDQAVEIMSPGKKIKAFEKEEKKIITEPSIDVLQPVEREEIIA